MDDDDVRKQAREGGKGWPPEKGSRECGSDAYNADARDVIVADDDTWSIS